jgi:hypothetical protein
MRRVIEITRMKGRNNMQHFPLVENQRVNDAEERTSPHGEIIVTVDMQNESNLTLDQIWFLDHDLSIISYEIITYESRPPFEYGNIGMRFINLTSHAIRLPDRTIEPSGSIARCIEETKFYKTIDGIDVVIRDYGEIENLPLYDPLNKSNTYYIVSMMVRQAEPHREDLLSPGDLIRDDEGNIIGCKNLVSNDFTDRRLPAF